MIHHIESLVYGYTGAPMDVTCCFKWLISRRASPSLGSDARSQTSCTTEYEGDMSQSLQQKQTRHERQPLLGPGADEQAYYTDPDSELYRDPRLPTPAKVRWLKAYHKVKQVIQHVSKT